MGAKKSTTYTYWRQRGDGKDTSFAGLDLLTMPFEVTMTAAKTSSDLIGKMPEGAAIWGVVNCPQTQVGDPRYDIGTSSASHAVAENINSQSDNFVTLVTAGGSIIGSNLTAQTDLYLWTSLATGGDAAPLAGTARGAILYTMNDGITS